MGVFQEMNEAFVKSSFWHMVISVISLVTPGVLYVLYFFPEYFISLDFFKIILISVAIIQPFILLNIIPMGFIVYKGREQGMYGHDPNMSTNFIAGTLSILIANLVLLAALLIAYLFQISNHGIFWLAIASQLIAFTVLYLLARGQDRAIKGGKDKQTTHTK